MTEVYVCTIGELKTIRCKDCGKRITFTATYCSRCYGKHLKGKKKNSAVIS